MTLRGADWPPPSIARRNNSSSELFRTPSPVPETKKEVESPTEFKRPPDFHELHNQICILEVAGVFVNNPRNSFLKDRLEWGMYYEQLGFLLKARIIYLKALADMIDLMNEDLPEVRLLKLHQCLALHIVDLDEKVQGEVKIGAASDLKELIFSLQEEREKRTTVIPSLKQNPKPQKSKIITKILEATRAPNPHSEAGLEHFLSGKTATDFQSTFKRKVSMRRRIIAIEAEPKIDSKSLRDQTILREKRKIAIHPHFPASDVPVYSNVDYNFLDSYLNSSFNGDIPTLSGLPLQIFHSIVFTIVFHLPISEEFQQTFQKDFITDNFSMISSIFHAQEGQKTMLQMGQYEQSIKYWEKVVDDDLHRQMNNLDKHPFYSKDSFFSDNDYRKWIENEKQRISSLVKPQHIKPKQGLKDRLAEKKEKEKDREKIDETIPQLDYHCIFVFLLSLILNKIPSNPVAIDDTDNIKLETIFPKYYWLLQEYAKRFGIGKPFYSITLFSLLCRMWRNSNLYLTMLKITISDLAKLESQYILTKLERKYLTESIQFLRNDIELWLSRYRILEPPSQVLEDAMEILQLFSIRFSKILQDYTSAKMITCIDMIITHATEELLENLKLSTLAACPSISKKLNYLDLVQLEMYLDALVDEAQHDVEIYSNSFGDEISYLSIVEKSFTRKLVQELKLFKASLSDQKEGFDSGKILDLLVNIFELTQILKIEGLFESKMDLEVFTIPVRNWLEKASEIFEQWIKEALRHDEWEVISETEPYSSSVVDLFSMLSELLEYVNNFYFMEDENHQLFTVPLAKLILDALNIYTEHIKKMVIKNIEEMQVKGYGGWSRNKIMKGDSKNVEKASKINKPFQKNPLLGLRRKAPGKSASRRKQEKLTSHQKGYKVTKTIEEIQEKEFHDQIMLLCILLNNLETCRMLLSDAISHFDRKQPESRTQVFSTKIQPFFTQIKDTLEGLLSLILESIQFTLYQNLCELSTSGFQSLPAQNLFQYFNFIFSPLADTFYPQLMDKFLKKTFEWICETITELINEKKPGSWEKKEGNFTQFLDSLILFFHADGDGLSLNFLRPHKEKLVQLIK